MNKLILYLRRVLHNCRKCGFSHFRSFFKLCNGLIRKGWCVKNTRSGGFSILEMSIVLMLMAATSIAGIKVLNGKIEQNAVDRVVADLTIVTEAAYACYVAGTCKGGNGWEIVEDKTAFAHLSSFLPPDFSANYRLETPLASGTETSKLVIRAVSLPNKRIAQRVANTFGSLAVWERVMPKEVVVTLGTPGTEKELFVRNTRSPTSCTDPIPYKIPGREPRKSYPSTMYIGEQRYDRVNFNVADPIHCEESTQHCRPTNNCTRSINRMPNITTIRIQSKAGSIRIPGRLCGIDGNVIENHVVEHCTKLCPIPKC